MVVRKGRFGPYAQHGTTVANLPRDLAMDDMTLESAVALLAEKGKVLKPKPGAPQEGARRRRPAAKAAAAAEESQRRKPQRRPRPARAKPKPAGPRAQGRLR